METKKEKWEKNADFQSRWLSYTESAMGFNFKKVEKKREKRCNQSSLAEEEVGGVQNLKKGEGGTSFWQYKFWGKRRPPEFHDIVSGNSLGSGGRVVV